MKIGIISKPDHAKSMVKALRSEGHKPIALGASPASLPNSLDVIVCRRLSCSHAGYATAMAERRSGSSRPVVFEDGAQRALEALREIEAGTYDQFSRNGLSDEVPPPEKTEETSRRGSCRQALVEVLDSCGLFFARLQDRSTSQIVDMLNGLKMLPGRKAQKGASDSLKDLTDKFAERTISKQFSVLRSSGAYFESEMWWKSDKGRKGPITILSKAPLSREQIEKLAEMSGYLATEPEVGTLTVPPNKAAKPKPDVAVSKKAADARYDVYGGLVLGVRDASGVPGEDTKPEPAKPSGAALPYRDGGHDLYPLAPQAEKELNDLLAMLRDQMDILGMREIPVARLNLFGLSGSLRVQTLHLNGPGGAACNHAHTTNGQLTKDINEVTCSTCQSTKFYSTAKWVLENMGGA